MLLVGELGQPLVFFRAFVKSTSVIAWGARLLSVAMIFALLWFVSFISWEWFLPVANFFVPFREFNLAIAANRANAGVSTPATIQPALRPPT